MLTVERLSPSEALEPWTELHRVAARHDVFQSYNWALMERDVQGTDPTFLVLVEGGDVVGGQVLLRRHVFGILRGYETAGGPLCREGREHEVMEAVADFVARRTGPASYRMLRPQAPHGFGPLLQSRGFRTSTGHTVIVSLSCGRDELWRRLDGNARTGVKKGAKEGVTVREAKTWEDWEAFGRLQAAHARARGISGLSDAVLHYLHDHLVPAGECKLFMGWLGEKCVSGMVFLVSGTSMLFLAGASDGEYLWASPNDPVMWAAISWGCDNGVRTLDLFDTDPREGSPLYGIHRFKAKWGGALVERSFYVQGRAYYWVRERLRENGTVRHVANILRRYRWA